MRLAGRDNGLLSGVLHALQDACGVNFEIADYHEHAIGHGSEAQAAAYVECRTPAGATFFGVGLDTDVASASVKALLSAANQAIATG